MLYRITPSETIKTAVGNAETSALEAARASYQEIASARDELNALEARGVYQPGYIEEQRQETAARVRQGVEVRLAGAGERVEAARGTVEGQLAELKAVDPSKLAAATGQFQLVFGSSLRENPEMLLQAYEKSFDNPVDRRALEELADRLLRTLPGDAESGVFESKWDRLQERLEDRLPKGEREARRGLKALERAAGYLHDVAVVTSAAIKGLTNPRQGGNLTVATRVHTYERELSGGSAVEGTLPQAFSSAG